MIRLVLLQNMTVRVLLSAANFWILTPPLRVFSSGNFSVSKSCKNMLLSNTFGRLRLIDPESSLNEAVLGGSVSLFL